MTYKLSLRSAIELQPSFGGMYVDTLVIVCMLSNAKITRNTQRCQDTYLTQYLETKYPWTNIFQDDI